MLGDQLLALLDEGDATALVASITSALKATTPPKALERAAALHIWKRTWEKEHPGSRRGGDRRSATYREEDQSAKFAFWFFAAKTTGLAERAIQMDIALAEDLGPTYIRAFWTSPIADNAVALRDVARREPRQRDLLIRTWSDNPKLSFSAALEAALLREREDAAEISFQRLVDAWARAGSKERRRFLIEIGVDPAAAEAAITAARKGGA